MMKYIFAFMLLSSSANADWSYTIDSKQMVGFRIELRVTYSDGKRTILETLSMNAEALEQLDDTLTARIGELERLDRIMTSGTLIGKKLSDIPDVATIAVEIDVKAKP